MQPNCNHPFSGLKAGGWPSLEAISRISMSVEKKAIGTYDIATFCHVTPATVGRWVNEGKLPHFTTGGGHRRVWKSDLVDFLRSHNMPVPIELLPKTSGKILIVDDDPAILKYLTKALRRFYPGIEIDEAKSGFEAGHKVSSSYPPPALVILDLKLPGTNGIAICEMMRKNDNFKDTRILAVTGYNIRESHKRALKAGANDFIAKPFELKDFITKVQDLLPVPAQN